MVWKKRKAVALLTLLAPALVCFCSTACDVVNSLGFRASPTATATSLPTPTATYTATATETATPAPTATPTSTVEPLRLTVNFHPVEVMQGHTLWVEVTANRAAMVSGALDERPLSFAARTNGAWAVAGVPVTAEPGAHAVQLRIRDALGADVSTTVPVVVLKADFGSEWIDVPPDRTNLLDPEVLEQEGQRLEQVFSLLTARQYWEGVFIWPHNGRVTSPFGMSRTYNYGQNGHHAGIDLSGEVGAPVVAAARGRVVLGASLTVHGNAVILDHGLGVYSSYYHLSEILVHEGEEVEQGALIARVGNTGLSTGAHLHWEMRVGGVAVDPSEWTTRVIPE